MISANLVNKRRVVEATAPRDTVDQREERVKGGSECRYVKVRQPHWNGRPAEVSQQQDGPHSIHCARISVVCDAVCNERYSVSMSCYVLIT